MPRRIFGTHLPAPLINFERYRQCGAKVYFVKISTCYVHQLLSVGDQVLVRFSPFACAKPLSICQKHYLFFNWSYFCDTDMLTLQQLILALL